ncbi:type II secretion system F family protein [Isoptericola sp. NEAU-Y5]|uniref:Type II secretion system F family protein n=1 Tax=Isoptericola luteus TaxID=2879484 RepID=A0ABS7ZAR5_9MICO|nr:type II secretion system F family protein [Isoptericola sp. NEAU-Y5]MCA5892139.1 type II secretion system F family protein [Isoptericola sp. NEAU-Y5]
MSAATPLAVVAVCVAVLALAAVAPWRAVPAGARRRVRHLAAGDGVPAPSGDPAPVELPVLLELLAAAARAGAAVPRALDATGDAVGGQDRAALHAAARALRLGAAWDTAWLGAPSRLGPLQRALRVAWVDGAASSAALRAARDEALHERRAAAAAAAARLGVRLVLPLGACFLPAFVLVGLVPVLIALGVDLLSG